VSFQENLNEAWMGAWLDAVAAGTLALSQRAFTSIEKHGGIATAVAAARARKVHLAELVDDSGRRLIAASNYPITTLC
jgi:hypothetical protein